MPHTGKPAPSRVTRRQFVQGLGAAATITGFGGAARAAGNPRGSTGRRVAVFGGGPAGMSAAHELAERGFDVHLYERHSVLGGKARSFSIPGTGTDGRKDLPAELGPHLFWGAYQNLGETLGRIPIGGGRTVLDNLGLGPLSSDVDLGLAMGWDGEVIRLGKPALATLPSEFSPQALLDLVTAVLRTVGRFTLSDEALLSSKFAALITSGPERQWHQLEDMTVTDFLCADRLSPNARQFLHVLMQQNTEPPERMNARVMAAGNLHHFFVNLITKGPGPGFTLPVHVGNGPSNEIWFDPWAAHLRRLGARIHTGQRLVELTTAGGRITGATVRGTSTQHTTPVQADHYVLAVPMDKAAELITPSLVHADPALGRIARLEQTWLGGMQIYLTHDQPQLESAGAALGAPWTIAWLKNTFWDRDFPAHYGDGTAIANFSIDIASWDRPGILYGKPAKQCTAVERFNEVRAQLRRDFGDQGILPDSAIHSWSPSPALVQHGTEPVHHDEPDFATTPGCWANQPEAVTGIRNLFLAASYVRTTAGTESMDCANEAGKKAANGVLAASNAPATPARVAPSAPSLALAPFWAEDDLSYTLGLPNTFDIIAPVFPHEPR